jgi:hypothetical protein
MGNTREKLRIHSDIPKTLRYVHKLQGKFPIGGIICGERKTNFIFEAAKPEKDGFSVETRSHR